MKAEAEEWIKTKLAKQYLKDCHVNPYDLPKILSDFAELAIVNSRASQPPEPNKPLRVPLPDDFLKERNRKVEEMKSWSWQYDEGWSDCEDWLRLNQKKYDKEFVNEVEAMISASPEPNTQRPEEIRTTSHKPEIIGKLYHTEPNTVTNGDDFKKYLYDKFMKVLPDLAFKEILSEGYADDIIEWLQQTQATPTNTVTEEEIDQTIHDICVFQERINFYHKNRPSLVDEISKLETRQRNSIKHLFQQTQAVGVSDINSFKSDLLHQARKVRNYSGPEEVYYAVPVRFIKEDSELLNQKK